uniref:Uncharacterized protein n=1 Tax=Oryctolagus cuniculus TaxID=9986 RepID=A0A5F9C821_RABIT
MTQPNHKNEPQNKEAVHDKCEPVMQLFSIHWPEMLRCDKFPEGEVCITMTPPNATEAAKPQGTTVCPPCDNELKSEAIIEHLCASEFGERMFPAAPHPGVGTPQPVLPGLCSQILGCICLGVLGPCFHPLPVAERGHGGVQNWLVVNRGGDASALLPFRTGHPRGGRWT